jgi:hypothetical protein
LRSCALHKTARAPKRSLRLWPWPFVRWDMVVHGGVMINGEIAPPQAGREVWQRLCGPRRHARRRSLEETV